MISFDEALAAIHEFAQPLGTEIVPLDQAAGRVLGSPVIAAIDSPRTDVSAMDGYAVRDADLVGGQATFAVMGESFPGSGWQGTVPAGSAIRIFTGAPVPAGADRVVIQELVLRKEDRATIQSLPTGSRWIRQRGADFKIGDTVIAKGRLIDPASLVAIAGADIAAVDVARQPRVALFATGDELVDPGTARQSPLGVPDSVSPALATFAAQWGGRITLHRRLRDDLPVMRHAAADVIEQADVVVVTGGASVGERDFAKAMFEDRKFELIFSKVAIRPGKPAWFARSDATLLLGLPGNPTSALVTARLLLAPLLGALQGRPVDDGLRWESARLSSALRSCDGRETFHRATLSGGEAILLPFQESHAQKTLADSQILVRQAAYGPEMPAGTFVPVLRL